MRTSRTAVLFVAAALVLAGCSDDASPDADPTSQSAEPTATPSATETAEPTDAPTEEPTATEEPTEEPTQEPAAPVTELPAAVMLPPESLYPQDGERTERDEVEDWLLPDACSVTAPTTAVDMRTVLQGDGQFEDAVGQQQVAVFPDVETAVAEADRIGQTLTGCTGAAPDDGTRTVAETVEVGTQGRGLVVDYHGTFASVGDEDALGYYVAVTRRANAITLVAAAGGEFTVSVSRERVVGELGAAWDLLCTYDSSGC